MPASPRIRPPGRWSRPCRSPRRSPRSPSGEHRGYEYSRSGNPTRTALETCLASLEQAAHGLAFASGLAAEDAVLRLLRPGDHAIIPNDAYGGTYRLFDKVWAPAGLGYTPADLTSVDRIREAWRDRTAMVWIETPSNPLLSIVDIGAVAAFAHERGALVVVDNTFATPYLQQPLRWGADVVVHSVDEVPGRPQRRRRGLRGDRRRRAGGADRVLPERGRAAFRDRWTATSCSAGIKTLALRMDRHCANAAAVAELLPGTPPSSSVLYPGLARPPGPRGRPTPDGGLRRDGVVRPGRRGAGRPRGRPLDVALHVGRVPRGGRVADRAPPPHDPRVGPGLAPRRRPGTDPPVGRSGDPRRPPRRPDRLPRSGRPGDRGR